MPALYKPKAKASNLVMQHVSDEVLLYDMAKHRAYCLNSTAALIWQKCDGVTTVAEIAEEFTTDRAALDVVWLAIDQLNSFDLLANPQPRRYDGSSRRNAIKALATTAFVTVPVVSTIATPTDNRGSLSVCVCVGSGDCVRVGCPSPPNCGPNGICI
ncbi:MAG: PqqD family protein [Chloracidobacterium sp.]|nr:PqqD family protein [Chloracidobacterium sp.]